MNCNTIRQACKISLEANVAKKAAADAAAAKAREGEGEFVFECLQGHEMEMLSSGSSWRCDLCQTSQHENPRLRCRRCDFDVCRTCKRGEWSLCLDKVKGVPVYQALPPVAYRCYCCPLLLRARVRTYAM